MALPAISITLFKQNSTSSEESFATMNLENAQTTMQQEQIDCWVVYDFQRTNPVMAQLIPDHRFLSRRLFLIIPAEGEPVILGSKIDNDAIQALPFRAEFYVSWQEMTRKLKGLLAVYKTVGLDYSPECALPVASRIDAGTFEMIKSLGKTVVSAADVFQAAAAVWSAEALEAHLEDCRRVAGIKDDAFQFIADQLRSEQQVTEYDVQQFIMAQFQTGGLTTPYPPIVAVNQNSGDPHYSPNAEKHACIGPDDWILIDLWAKRPGYQFIFADMTWVGVAGAAPSPQQREVFEVVKGARDTAVTYLRTAAKKGDTVAGWQVDDAVRRVVNQAGYGEFFFHRTGHSLGPGDHVHGQGVNIDNLETHDTRKLLPGIGFSIEPGVYLPAFGIRSEINVYMAEGEPLVTTPIQDEIIFIR
jgi:Xaa-Pro dipeptidase